MAIGSIKMANIAILKEQIKSYCHARPEVVACYLFGSHAAGTNRPGSDLDIAFLLTDATADFAYDDFRFRAIVELGRITRLDIHPLIMNIAGEVVLGQVFRKGACLYGYDNEVLRAFRRRKLPLIAEFGYYLELMQTGLRQRYNGQAHG